MPPETAPPPHTHIRIRWVLITIASLVLIYTITGFVVVPRVIQSYGARRLGEALQRPVKIAEAAFNPYTFVLRLKGLAIDEADGRPLVRLQELFTDFSVTASLGGMPTVARLDLVGPELYLTRLSDGTFNLAHLGPPAAAGPAPAETQKSGEGPKFKLVDITLDQGRVVFRDETAEGFQTTLSPITATLSNLTTAPDQQAACTLTVATEAGEKLALDGRLTLAELAAEGRLALSGITLSKYAPYYRGHVGFEKADGRLDLDLSFRYSQKQTRIDPLSVTLSALAIADPKTAEQQVALSRLSVGGVRVDTAKRSVTVDQVGIEGLSVAARRDAEGRLDLVSLFAPPAAGTPPQESGELFDKPDSAAPAASPAETTAQPPAESFGKAGEAPAVKSETVSEAPAAHDPGAPPQEAAASSWVVEVQKITLAAGPLKFEDATGGQPAQASLESLGMQIGPLTIHGQSVQATDLALEMQHLDIKDPDSGLESLGVRIESVTAQGQRVQVAGLGLEMQNLALKDPAGERKLVEMPRLALSDTAIDTAQRTVQAGRLEILGTRINVRRLADGRIDLVSLFKQPAAETPAARVEDSKSDGTWQVSLDTLALKDHGVRFEDRVPKPAVVITVDDLGFQVEKFSTAAGAAPRIQLSGRINQKGALSVSGPMTLDPLSAELDVKLQDLSIGPFQPYFQDQVQLTVKDGQVGAEGRLSLALPAEGSAKIRYQGKASVSRFIAVDNRQQQELLRWKNLFVEGADIATEPMRIQLGRVALSDYEARLIIRPDGTLNMAEAFKAPGQAGQPETEPAPASKGGGSTPVPIKVDEVTLQGGEVDFSDFLTQPNFQTRMVKLGGRVSGLSSQADQRAEVLVQGALENQSPLEISGRINPLAQETYTDLKLTFRNIELSPFSPYSGKYIGYTLAKGKLTLELDYKIAERRLQAQNRIYFDALTLGDRVESPDATGLPIKLALALLTDRQGRIELNVPVQGNLDDPQFSIFGIVVKALVNLLTKIVTAPFDALASMFSGQIVTQVAFGPASADLEAEARSQVAKLADVLYDRPALKLEIEGTADSASDGPAIRRQRFDALLQKLKLDQLAAAGQNAPAPEQIRIAPEEREAYIAQAYAAAEFPKPRDEAGKEKILPPEEMEKLLYTQIDVSDNDLRRLANERAAAVRDDLLADERIKAERIFLVQPKVEGAAKAETARQVRFSLK
jgi:uncharacterized protein involved in outer membrane biogenesis